VQDASSRALTTSRLRRQAGVYKPLQIEEFRRPGGLLARRQGLHVLHARLPEVPQLGARRRRVPVRPQAGGRGAQRIYKDIVTREGIGPGAPRGRPDGGLVSAILLYCLEKDIIDAALVSHLEGDGSTWKAIPGVAKTKEDIIASAGSRYTYSANPMAYAEAVEGWRGADRTRGMSCQSSMPPVMKQRKAGKVARRLSLNIGLLCSKTFDDAIFEELFEAKYGLHKKDIKKMNSRASSRSWMHNGDYHEVPSGVPPWTREGCKACPTSRPSTPTSRPAAWAKFNDWTLHHRPHRPGARDHGGTAGRGLDRRPPG